MWPIQKSCLLSSSTHLKLFECQVFQVGPQIRHGKYPPIENPQRNRTPQNHESSITILF